MLQVKKNGDASAGHRAPHSASNRSSPQKEYVPNFSDAVLKGMEIITRLQEDTLKEAVAAREESLKSVRRESDMNDFLSDSPSLANGVKEVESGFDREALDELHELPGSKLDTVAALGGIRQGVIHALEFCADMADELVALKQMSTSGQMRSSSKAVDAPEAETSRDSMPPLAEIRDAHSVVEVSDLVENAMKHYEEESCSSTLLTPQAQEDKAEKAADSLAQQDLIDVASECGIASPIYVQTLNTLSRKLAELETRVQESCRQHELSAERVRSEIFSSMLQDREIMQVELSRLNGRLENTEKLRQLDDESLDGVQFELHRITGVVDSIIEATAHACTNEQDRSPSEASLAKSTKDFSQHCTQISRKFQAVSMMDKRFTDFEKQCDDLVSCIASIRLERQDDQSRLQILFSKITELEVAIGSRRVEDLRSEPCSVKLQQGRTVVTAGIGDTCHRGLVVLPDLDLASTRDLEAIPAELQATLNLGHESATADLANLVSTVVPFDPCDTPVHQALHMCGVPLSVSPALSPQTKGCGRHAAHNTNPEVHSPPLAAGMYHSISQRTAVSESLANKLAVASPERRSHDAQWKFCAGGTPPAVLAQQDTKLESAAYRRPSPGVMSSISPSRQVAATMSTITRGLSMGMPGDIPSTSVRPCAPSPVLEPTRMRQLSYPSLLSSQRSSSCTPVPSYVANGQQVASLHRSASTGSMVKVTARPGMSLQLPMQEASQSVAQRPALQSRAASFQVRQPSPQPPPNIIPYAGQSPMSTPPAAPPAPIFFNKRKGRLNTESPTSFS